jgi:hypothetical protein
MFAAQVPFLIATILLIRWSGRADTLRGHVLAAIVISVWSLYWFLQPIRYVLITLSDKSSLHITKASCDLSSASTTLCALFNAYASASILVRNSGYNRHACTHIPLSFQFLVYHPNAPSPSPSFLPIGICRSVLLDGVCSTYCICGSRC